MRRLWPRSIAGRATLVLIGGLVAVLWLGAGVWWLTQSGQAGPPAGHMLLQKVVTITAIVDRLPPEQRTVALDASRSTAYRAEWIRTRPTSAIDRHGWFTNWAVKRLSRQLGAHGISRFEAGHAVGDTDRNPIARIRLSDGTWLQFTATGPHHRPIRLVGFILVILVVTGGILVLALWVSRRVTAPLGRFSAAASRLGTDVDAPPLAETGPSEIREAAHAFNQMQLRITRFVDDRTRMLAAISHDLRTMLTRLRLRTEFIDDKEQREKAYADIEEMGRMLRSTLSFARDDALSEASTSVDLSGLLQTLCDDFSDGGEPSSFDGPPRVTVVCRPTALRRAFSNLIDNAVKYGGEARVTLARDADEIVIEIADPGPGIPVEQRENVFAPFFRIEQSRSRETGGVGLGLSLARNLIRGHGGDVTLDDRPGGGLIARAVLPVSPAA